MIDISTLRTLHQRIAPPKPGVLTWKPAEIAARMEPLGPPVTVRVKGYEFDHNSGENISITTLRYTACTEYFAEIESTTVC